MSNVTQRLMVGLAYGCVIGVGFSFWVLVVRIVGGSNALADYGLTVIQAIVAYLGGGLIGGLLMAGLLPLRRSAFGSALIGFVLLLPVFVGVSVIAVSPSNLWGIFGIPGAVVLSAVVGGVIGIQEWSESGGEWE